jgi:hypothetical protein
VSNRKSTGLLELPISWMADDYPYYEPEAAGAMPSPDDAVYQVYKAEFSSHYLNRYGITSVANATGGPGRD